MKWDNNFINYCSNNNFKFKYLIYSSVSSVSRLTCLPARTSSIRLRDVSYSCNMFWIGGGANVTNYWPPWPLIVVRLIFKYLMCPFQYCIWNWFDCGQFGFDRFWWDLLYNTVIRPLDADGRWEICQSTWRLSHVWKYKRRGASDADIIRFRSTYCSTHTLTRSYF